MRSILFAALPVVALAAPVADLQPQKNYIVKLAEQSIQSANVQSVTGAGPKETYEIGSFRAQLHSLTPEQLESVKNMQGVESVEEDGMMYASALTSQSGAPYGIARISRRQRGSTTYVYDDSAGAGTFTYIIDTGILTTHNEFGGRASTLVNTVGDGNNQDCNGHGTHVAGTAGGSTYGVAKRTTLIAVKVLGCNGSGSNSGVIRGIQAAVNDAKSKGRIGKAVANMSLGGTYSQATNDAVASAVAEGLFFAVAAGNEDQDANNVSPASERSACTVAASDSSDVRASFSNFGSAVDIFAPGVNVLSSWIGGNTATRTISGTSMSSPHIAGLGAYLIGLGNSANGLCSRIQNLATRNVISDTQGSINALAYNGSGQ